MIQGHGDDTYRYKDIRVNFSSNIFGHADMSALQDFLCQHISVINTYPEPEALPLAEAIARKENVNPACVLVTNGATEAIYLLAQSLHYAGYRHYFVEHPTFSEYEDACRGWDMEPARQPDTDCISWICNPNNPTGHVTPADALPRCGAVVIDQSYEDFTTEQLMSAREATELRNVWQIHSLTKTYAVPGLRIGYIVAAEENIRLLHRFQRPWSVNALAIVAGKWLIENRMQAVADVKNYLKEARRLARQLNSLPGVSVVPTQTNFMLAKLERHSAKELKEYLATRHHLLIRDASNFAGLDGHYFRVSAQLPKETDLLVQAVAMFLNKKSSSLTY